MKKSLTIISSLLIASYSAFATGVSFTVEDNQLLIGGVAQDNSSIATNSLTAYGFFVSDANFSAFITDDIWTGAESSITDVESAGIFAFMNANGYAAGGSIAAAPVSPSFFPTFTGVLNSGSAGNHAVLVVTGNVGGTDYLGVVATTAVTLGLGALPVGFLTGANSWDTTLLGTAGSLNLASVVPEPSTYAALAGLCALSFVMVRRRRA